MEELVELEMIDQLAGEEWQLIVFAKFIILAEIIEWLTPCLVVLMKVSPCLLVLMKVSVSEFVSELVIYWVTQWLLEMLPHLKINVIFNRIYKVYKDLIG